MIPRVRLSNRDVYDYEVQIIRIFKDCKAEKLPKDKLYDYRVGAYRFKIDHSEYSFTVFYRKDGEETEQKFSCNNEENVIDRVKIFVNKIRGKS